MSASLSAKVNVSRPEFPVIEFGITDETFAVSSLRSGNLTGWFNRSIIVSVAVSIASVYLMPAAGFYFFRSADLSESIL